MSPLYTRPPGAVVLPTDPYVVLDESRFPGAFSVDYGIATAARDAAITACFTDPWTGGTSPRPRPLRLVPFKRADGTNGKAHSYHWDKLYLDTIAATYGLGSSGDVRYSWGIEGNSLSTFGHIQVRVKNGSDFINWPTTFNVADFWHRGYTILGQESLTSTQNCFVPPGGRALKDFHLYDMGIQWFNNQLWASVGRGYFGGKLNFNNAISRAVTIAGSDGTINADWYIDSRAMKAGSYLLDVSMSSFTVGTGGIVYITPNSAGGAKFSGRIEGLEARIEVNGLGDQAPEYCYNPAWHTGSGLLTGSPSVAASTVPGLIYWDSTSKTFVCSNGTAWSLYSDGSAIIDFDDTGVNAPTRPTVGVAGKVYRNVTPGVDFSAGAGATNTSIAFWVYWNGGWRGPGYWNRMSVPSHLAADGWTYVPCYIGCDVPGVLVTGTRGSGVIRGSLALVGMTPGMVNGAWGGSACVVDAKDPVHIEMEASFVGGGKYPLRVHNSGAVPVVHVTSDVTVSQSRSDDPPASGIQRVGVCRVVEGGQTTARVVNDVPVPDNGTGVDITDLSVYLYPNERVLVEAWIDTSGGVGDATTAADVTASHSLPAGASHGLVYGGPPTAATGSNTSINQAVGSGVNLGTFPAQSRITVKGWIQTGATGGLYTIHLTRVATGASMPTIKAGSQVQYRRAA